ncbi:MAG: MFS transporter [Acutalibacteraceae bacterium]
MEDKRYNKTIYACFSAYIVQAIIVNFAPLLFLTFESSFNIPLGKITMLITINFCAQFVTDLLSAKFIDKIGYRVGIMLANSLCAIGLVSLSVLPFVLSDAFTGLLISTMIYAVGGGLLEVIVSPLVESCPSSNKESAMSLLHSFYSWGQVGVVLISTVFFKVFGIGQWRFAALIWAILPIVNTFVFAKVPIAPLIKDGEKSMTIKELFKTKIFWVLFLMMLCAGASELAVSQWASAFCEQALGVSKTVGDLLGPMMFAVTMGISRVFYGKFGEKIDLDKFMVGSSLLCVASYLMVSLSPSATVGLLGCGVCGLSVGIMWPGSISKASATIKTGGSAMFALLALGGDIGCTTGPTLAGLVSSFLGDDLKKGILSAVIFPILLVGGVLLCRKQKSPQPTANS